VAIVGLLLLGHERKEAHTTPTKKEQRHQQQHLIIIYYVTDMECPDVQIVVAG